MGQAGETARLARVKSNIPEAHLDAGMDIWACNQAVNANTSRHQRLFDWEEASAFLESGSGTEIRKFKPTFPAPEHIVSHSELPFPEREDVSIITAIVGLGSRDHQSQAGLGSTCRFLESSTWWNMEQCFDRRRGTRQICEASCAKTSGVMDDTEVDERSCQIQGPGLPVVVAWRLRGNARRRSETVPVDVVEPKMASCVRDV